MPEKNYHSLKPDQVLKDLNSNDKGLSEKEAQKRLEKEGLNKLVEQKSISKINIFFSQFNNILIYILLVASAISFFFQEYIDAGVILVAVFLNTIIGYFQENKAQSDLSKLRHYIKQTVFVRRDEQQHLINTEKLVPGDIILIQAGSRISADARIIESNELKVDESVLTGESIAVDKDSKKVAVGAVSGDRTSMVYMGTTVVRGNAVCVVTATGMNTEIGKIAGYVSQTEDEHTPLQLRLKKLGKIIGLFSLIICGLIFGLGILLSRSALEMFLISVAIAVSSIPEGLPVAITVILAIGMQRILKKKSLVRRLVAAETLGSTTVICTDKTGTLTMGKMKVSDIILDNEIINLLSFKNKKLSERTKEIFRVGLLCNDAFFEDQESVDKSLEKVKIDGSPTDQALLLAGVEAGLSLSEEKEKYPQLKEVAFDSSKKYMLTLHEDTSVQKGKEEKIILCKGAPEVVIDHCSFIKTNKGIKKLTQNQKEELNKIQDKLTSKGLRLLAIARRDLNQKLIKEKLDDNFEQFVLLGLIALKDPLREDSKKTINTCLKAGIKPVIITGDHKLTAKAVAEELGLKISKDNILSGEELDKLNDDDLRSKVKKINLYARVSPHHKLRIVKALQENNEVVAMAGDGINDAPAIQMADIGIALGSGTDIAKETAEIVLLDNRFSVIVDAVKQGRIIFDNMRKIIVYLLSDSFSGMLLIISAIALGLPLPLIPAQILWINIVNDSFPNFALAFEKGGKDIMTRQPLAKNEPILDKEMKFLIFVIGVFTDIGIIALFLWLLKSGHDIEHVRTFMFAALGIDSLIYVYSCKNLRNSIWNYKLFDNKYLVMATAVSFLMLMVGIYVPFFQGVLRTVSLGLEGWEIMIGVALFEVVSIEFGKWIFIHQRRKHWK